MADCKQEPPIVTIDLPAAYSQGGFVQVRSVVLQTESGITPNATAANDGEPQAPLLSAS